MKRMHVIMLLTLSILVLTSPLYAGGQSEKAENTGQEEKLIFTDQTDREVRVTHPVNRIVTIPIPAASMMIAMDGCPERLVGMHPMSKTTLEEGILKEFYPEALEIRSDIVGQGFMPNPEALLEVDPDIIFQAGHLGMDVVSPLENAGLNVGLLIYESPESIEGWIATFGKVLGKQDKADRILAWHHSTRKTITEQVEEIPEEEKPRVLYFLRYLSPSSPSRCTRDEC